MGLSRFDMTSGKGAQDESAGTTVLELPPVEGTSPTVFSITDLSPPL